MCLTDGLMCLAHGREADPSTHQEELWVSSLKNKFQGMRKGPETVGVYRARDSDWSGGLGMKLWNLRLEHVKKRQTERRGNGGRADSLGNVCCTNMRT